MVTHSLNSKNTSILGVKMRSILVTLVVLAVSSSATAGDISMDKIRAGIGYKLHAVCSGLFHQKIPMERIDKNLAALDPILSKLPIQIDHKKKRVSFLRMKETYYRPGFGCIMRQNPLSRRLKTPEVVNEIVNKPLERIESAKLAELGIDETILQRAVDTYMAEESTIVKNGHSRAIVVAYKNNIIAEKYLRDFNAESKNISWSVAKSVTAVLAGIAIDQGIVQAGEAVPAKLEQFVEGDLNGLTLDDLLQMKAGLAFDEDYDNYSSDVFKMLLTKENMAKYVIQKPMTSEPGETLNYSTGTTQLVSAFLRYSMENDEQYLRFPAENLFKPLGTSSAEFTLDQSGTFVGGAWVYMTAEDWTKFGILMQNKGVAADGTRILSSATFSWLLEPANEQKTRARHFQINIGGNNWKDLPEDAFAAVGHFSQLILAVPSKELVIVRLGLTTKGGFDLNGLGREVLASFK